MVTLQEILQLLNHSDFLASHYLQYAYFHIPIRPKHLAPVAAHLLL